MAMTEPHEHRLDIGAVANLAAHAAAGDGRHGITSVCWAFHLRRLMEALALSLIVTRYWAMSQLGQRERALA